MKRKNVNKIGLIFFSSFRFLIVAATLSICFSAYGAPVCRIHDGDTFTLCSGLRIRLACVDAPEVKHDRQAAQPIGYQSRDYLKTMILNKEVQLDCVGKSYDRKVCFVSINGQDVNEALLRQGLAYSFTKYSYCRRVEQEYNDAQRQAQESHAGVWSLPAGGVKPWEYRKHKLKTL